MHQEKCFYDKLSIPTYRNIVEKMLQDPETLENFITAASGLCNDPAVTGISIQAKGSKMTRF